jgi:hypothetical protein
MSNILAVLGVVGPLVLLCSLLCGLGHAGNDTQSVIIKNTAKEKNQHAN